MGTPPRSVSCARGTPRSPPAGRGRRGTGRGRPCRRRRDRRWSTRSARPPGRLGVDLVREERAAGGLAADQVEHPLLDAGPVSEAERRSLQGPGCPSSRNPFALRGQCDAGDPEPASFHPECSTSTSRSQWAVSSRNRQRTPGLKGRPCGCDVGAATGNRAAHRLWSTPGRCTNGWSSMGPFPGGSKCRGTAVSRSVFSR